MMSPCPLEDLAPDPFPGRRRVLNPPPSRVRNGGRGVRPGKREDRYPWVAVVRLQSGRGRLDRGFAGQYAPRLHLAPIKRAALDGVERIAVRPAERQMLGAGRRRLGDRVREDTV